MSHSQESEKENAIGVFDSGVGGLTVVKQIIHTLPNEKIIYFGDTARVPYGGKSAQTIVRYSIENAHFLMQQSIKMLVVACNTVSAYALDQLQSLVNIPVIGVIEPGAYKAVQTTKTGHIAVLGTKATIQSGVYQKEILKRFAKAQVMALACPLLVPLVEENLLFHDATRMIIKEYLKPLYNTSVDTILLGCTHYPLLRELIEQEVGPKIAVVDSASTCAEQVSQLLDTTNRRALRHEKLSHRFFVSDDPEKFKHLGESFLKLPLSNVELANVEKV